MSAQIKDILQPLPVEEWHFLQNHTKHKWPLYAYIHYWIENGIRWKKRDPGINIQLYCPNGDHTCGTFVGISNFSLYIVLTFSLDETGETLIKALTDTSIIDWGQGVYFAGTHGSIAPFVLSAIDLIKDKYGIVLDTVSSPTYYYKSAEECASVKIRIPEECNLRTMNRSHIPYVHSIWPHKDLELPDLSISYLTHMIEFNCGLGLFLKEDDSLVSWALHTDWYGMGMVQTAEEHKRKGYAKVVINALAKKLGEEGIPTTLFIVEGNDVSQKMFEGLGWRSICFVSWIVLKRKKARM